MHQEYKNILTILKDNPQVDTNTHIPSAQPNMSLCPLLSTAASSSKPSNVQLFSVHSTSTTSFNNPAIASLTLGISCSDSHQSKDKGLVEDEPHRDPCVGVGCGEGVTAGLMSDSILSCVVGQGGGRRGGGV